MHRAQAMADMAHVSHHRLVYDYRIGTRVYVYQDSSDVAKKQREKAIENRYLTPGSPLQQARVKVNTKEFSIKPLRFESRFESGNLAQATQVGNSTYTLKLHNDVNTKGNIQWFYFAVSEMTKSVEYTFRITNYTKTSSLFENGMLPVVYSTKAKKQENKGWHRAGTDVAYFKNSLGKGHSNSVVVTSNEEGYCLAFKYRFEYDDDTVYLAYCYPYTYTRLRRDIADLEAAVDPSVFRRDTLCTSLAGNSVECLTFPSDAVQTAPGFLADRVAKEKARGGERAEESGSESPVPAEKPLIDTRKPVILLTARVHPGEVVASHIIIGIIRVSNPYNPNPDPNPDPTPPA